MATKPSTVRFCVLLSPDGRAKLEALAAADRRSSGSWIRLAIERAYEEVRRTRRIRS